mgnify:CR=1 FL=1
MRVLLVEDDYAVSQSIETMLKKEGMIIDTTDLGEDGLEIGKLYDYDIIILDLMLPDMNGYEVLKRLRSAKIETPVLMIHGEKAHSRYFSETAYSKLTGDNKELLIIPGANHTDLYDQMDIIPFEKLNAFFTAYLR